MRRCLPGIAALAATVTPAPASAHAFAERYDLPLPLGFYLAGAGFAVALSFLGSFLLVRPGQIPRLQIDIRVPAVLSGAARSAVRAAAVILMAAVIMTGLAGPPSPTQNFATVFVWVYWWVGFALFTALAVDLWTTGNPFRVVTEWVLRAAGLDGVRRVLSPIFGWIAVAGLLAVAWLELISDSAENPRALVAVIAGYVLLLVAGAARAGTASWFGTADPLTRLFGLLGRMAPLAPGPDGLRVRLPGSGLVGLSPGVPEAVFVIGLIAIVLFDGLSETPFWAAILDWITRSQGLRPWLLDLREAGIDILKLIRTTGLIATMLGAVLAYLGLATAMWLAVRRALPLRAVFTGFAASLMPIAVAYHLAHYVSYLALAGQLMVPIVSDPFGLGWDLFGGANVRVSLGAISARQTWWIAAVSLVSGHGLSVLVAHAEALRLLPDRRLAILSQLPMMVFMVGLTLLSLWILAQPIVA